MRDHGSQRGDHRYLALLTLVVACYALIFLRLQSQWWFEDDPYLLAVAGQHRRPWDFFLSRDGLSQGLVGVQFTPLQNLTYWIDGQLAPRSALFAYAHTTVSLWLGMLVLFLVLRYWLRPREASAVVLLYLLLPATIVVAEFVSTRNYLDGFLLSLISVWMVQRAISTRGARYVLFIAAAVVFYVLGSLAKQLYLTATFTLIVILCAHRRRWSAVVLFCLAGVGYLGYYWWIFGSLNSTWNAATLSAADYPGFLLRYPYIVAGGAAGWFLAVLWLAAIGYGTWRRVLRGPELAAAAGLVIITVASLHPVAGALNSAYATSGTWYRVSFVSSSVILFVGAWLLCKLPNPRIVAAVAVCTAVTLAAGAWSTVRTWDAMKRRYRIEGKFYLEHPDRLVYSELPAWWYLVGLDDLYHVAARHYVVASRPGQPGDRDVISRFSAAWRYSPNDGGRFVYDPELYQRLANAK